MAVLKIPFNRELDPLNMAMKIKSIARDRPLASIERVFVNQQSPQVNLFLVQSRRKSTTEGTLIRNVLILSPTRWSGSITFTQSRLRYLFYLHVRFYWRRTEYVGPNWVFWTDRWPQVWQTDRRTDGQTDRRTDRHNKGALGLLVINTLKLSSG